MAVYALRRLKIKNSKAFMIGDTVNVIKMDKNTNINTLGVTWGYNDQEELRREIADHVVNDQVSWLKYWENTKWIILK